MYAPPEVHFIIFCFSSRERISKKLLLFYNSITNGLMFAIIIVATLTAGHKESRRRRIDILSFYNYKTFSL